MWLRPIMGWKCIWSLVINTVSSNKPDSSFITKNLYKSPVKLLSKTNGPTNLLLSKPNHIFTETLLYNLVTIVSHGFPWDHVHNFCEIFMLSQVKECGTNPYTEQCLLVQDVEPFDHDIDTTLHHAQFSAPAYATHWCERQFYKRTVVDFPEPSRECSLVCSWKALQ
jgi:hypothetical protein